MKWSSVHNPACLCTSVLVVYCGSLGGNGSSRMSQEALLPASHVAIETSHNHKRRSLFLIRGKQYKGLFIFTIKDN